MNWTEATSTRSVRGSSLPGSLPSQGSAVTLDPKPLAHQPTCGSTLCRQEVRKFSSDMRAAVTAILPLSSDPQAGCPPGRGGARTTRALGGG